MKIEIGNKYINRLGHEVLITSESGIPNHPFKDADGNYYTDDGHYIDNSFDTERDLVTRIITIGETGTIETSDGNKFEFKVTKPDSLPNVAGMGVAVESAPSSKPEETPSSEWHKDGEPDPHGKRYDCERAELEMGHMTDDVFANAFYLYNHRTGLQSELWLNAAKSRIRWLSRALEKALEKKSKPSVSETVLLGEVERLRGALKVIATQAKTQHPNTLRIIEINATQALRKK